MKVLRVRKIPVSEKILLFLSSQTGWSESAIEKDFEAFDRQIKVWKSRPNSPLDQKRMARFFLWSDLCGPLCCPWRARHGKPCNTEYAEWPFSKVWFSPGAYNLLPNVY